MANNDDTGGRLTNFAVRTIKLCDNLPKTRTGNHIADNLLQSATAPAVLYAEARSATSIKDGVDKLKQCLKELTDSGVWLEIIAQGEILPKAKLPAFQQECDELSGIISASIKAAQQRL